MSSEIHAGHRERLRKRFEENGFAGFQQHEILEFILGYAIPQKDLNPVAHALINHFGSLSAVLDASVDDLKKVDGIGSYSAVFINMFPKLFRVYSELRGRKKALYSADDAGEFLKPKFYGLKYEIIYGIFLDSKCMILKHCILSEGNINSVPMCTRKICEIAFQTGANTLVIAHNHPSGIALPSKDDIYNTANLSKSIKDFDIMLMDHLIFADDDYISLASSRDFDDIFKGKWPKEQM